MYSPMRRASSRLLAGSLALAILALASTLYEGKLLRDFSAPTAIAIGRVVDQGAFIPKGRKASSSEWFCWVEYQFYPKDAVTPRKGWGLWMYACDVKPGADVPIQYVVDNPDGNRPVGGGPPIPALVWWFAAGVTMVIGVLRRGAEETDRSGSLTT